MPAELLEVAPAAPSWSPGPAGRPLQLDTAELVLWAFELGLVERVEARALLGLVEPLAASSAAPAAEDPPPAPDPVEAADVAGDDLAPAWLAKLVDDWLRSLRRRGRTPKTIEVFGSMVRDFGRWLGRARVGAVEELAPAHLHGWQDSLWGRGLSPSSRYVAASALRGFLRWGVREERGVRPGLWERVEPIKVRPGLPRPLPADDVRRILQHYTAAAAGLLPLRDRALFLVLLTSGARISEVLPLQLAAGRSLAVTGSLIVRQKGGTEKRLVISPLAARWLGDYLQLRGEDGQPAVWIRPAQRSPRPLRLSPQESNRIWERLAEELGLDRWTNHQLRHTCATELLEHGATTLDAAEQLGHHGLGNIHRYAEVRDGRRRGLAARLDDLVAPAGAA